MTRRSLALAFLLALTPSLAARQADAGDEERGPEPLEFSYSTPHELSTPDGTLSYWATASTYHLEDENGEAEAEFFAVTYTLRSEVPAPERPVTFAFNGGPGSASVWLHMGLLGPRLVQVPSDGRAAGAPPYPLVDNPNSLLAVSDLVMVDPIGTGYSRVVADGDTADHWGVDEDARSVARFIRRWLTVNERWASPKYILGESYGGIRGPLLVRELQSGFNAVALNGLILVSPALDMELVDGRDTDAMFATVLPTFAATAWYHDALPERPADLDAFLAEVRAFVRNEYVPGLFAGRDLPAERYDALVAKLHRYTGLSEQYLRRANLRVSTDRFRRELLRDRGLVVGRLDTRYTGTEPDDVGESASGDPFGSGVSGAYVAGFRHYLRSELDVDIDREYMVMSGEAGNEWKRPQEDWPAFQGFLDVAPVLARGMANNPDLRVFIANGLYDIATTFHAAEVNVAQSTMDRDRVAMKNYPAGHMMYVHHPTLVELAEDVKAFIAAGAKGAEN